MDDSQLVAEKGLPFTTALNRKEGFIYADMLQALHVMYF